MSMVNVVNNDNQPLPTMDDVVAGVGVELYTYLEPRDLFTLSCTNRSLRDDIDKDLFTVCSRQLASLPVDGDDDEVMGSSVVISKDHSFHSRDELSEHLLEKIKLANLRLRYGSPDFVGTDTLEGTLAKTRQAINDEASRSGSKGWYGIFNNDPAEIWKASLKQPFTVGYNFEDELRRGRSRGCFIDWKLRNMDSQGINSKKIVRDWARFIISHQGIVGREWQWKCDDQEVIGFLITRKEGTEIQIKWTKKIPEEEAKAPASPPTRLLSAFGF